MGYRLTRRCGAVVQLRHGLRQAYMVRQHGAALLNLKAKSTSSGFARRVCARQVPLPQQWLGEDRSFSCPSQ